MERLVEVWETLTVEDQDKLNLSLSIEIPAHQTSVETLSEVEILKKSLEHYKSHNGYLNDSSD